jgi:hypothetical protein
VTLVPGGDEQLVEFLSAAVFAGIDPLEVADQLGSDPAACLTCGLAPTVATTSLGTRVQSRHVPASVQSEVPT